MGGDLIFFCNRNLRTVAGELGRKEIKITSLLFMFKSNQKLQSEQVVKNYKLICFLQCKASLIKSGRWGKEISIFTVLGDKSDFVTISN